MSGAVQELIPFKVELMPFEDLLSDEEWGLIEKGVKSVIQGDFLMRIARSGALSEWKREYEQKMMEHPTRKAFEKVYTEWVKPLSGEWIVVGKIGEYYLAAQPKRVTKMLPVECCRFVGLL